jgi:hypothetical protein
MNAASEAFLLCRKLIAVVTSYHSLFGEIESRIFND